MSGVLILNMLVSIHENGSFGPKKVICEVKVTFLGPRLAKTNSTRRTLCFFVGIFEVKKMGLLFMVGKMKIIHILFLK